MLRSDFPFRSPSFPVRVAMFLLGEAFLGFCAIIATALTLFPILFDVSPRVSDALENAQWTIIGLFAVEYLTAFVCTKQRLAFLINPWRLLDLFTIVVPLLTLLPSISGALRSSPILRLVRLIRVVTMGVRASGAVVREGVRQASAATRTGPATIERVRARNHSPAPATWQELLQWVRAPASDGWYHVSSPSSSDLDSIASSTDIPSALLKAHLLGTGYPHVESLGRYAGFFVWLPELQGNGQVERKGIYLLIGADHLLSFSNQPTSLLKEIALGSSDSDTAPFSTRTAALFLRTVLQQSEKLVSHFETELHALEETPVRDSREAFFERTFRLKKELSATQSDLWRLKNLLSELSSDRARLPGAGAGSDNAEFVRLSSDADYLYETIVNIREEVLSLIDLHLNIVSFDMNRVMRVLAVVSVLGLIPGVVGGLFGMNLADNPWPFTLPQVAFSVVLGMIVTLYLFFVKGWLR